MGEVTDIWANIVLRERHKCERENLVRKLPSLRDCPHPHFLSLGRFFEKVPERFFCQRTFSDYKKFLEDEHANNPKRLRGLLVEENAHLNLALLFLDEINRHNWHEQIDDGDEYEKLRFIDVYLHPAYLRMVDGVFFRFVRLVAMVSRLNRNVGTDGLDLYSAVEELPRSPLPNLGALYCHIIRNGIAHGGVAFGRNEIKYVDKAGNSETRSVYEVVRFVDDLVDVCNGMVLALSLFLIVHIREGYSMPQYVLISELQAQTRSPWWWVDGCVPCRIPEGTQLLIYAHPNTRDVLKAYYFAFYTAVLAELLASGYDRYFLSLRSSKALPGFAAFSGAVLKQVRQSEPSDVLDYKGALVDDLLMFAPNIKLPRILGMLDTLCQAMRVTFPTTMSEVRRKLNRPTLVARAASIHRNGAFSILHGSIVISSPQGTVNKETVRVSCRRIIEGARSLARSRLSVIDPTRFLPVGWGRVAVFRKDYRERRLTGFGLGADLVCTVQVQTLTRVRAPDIAGSTVEKWGRYRIAWNKEWLEDLDGSV